MLLLLLICIPLIGGIALLLLSRREDQRALESLGIAFAIANLAIGSILAYQVNARDEILLNKGNQTFEVVSAIAPRLEYTPSWLQLKLPATMATNAAGWQLSLGADGIGAELVLLTVIVTLATLVIAYKTIEADRVAYAAWMLIASSGLILFFTAMDLVTFYIGFEITLIPLYMMIVGWGKADAPAAAKKFVLFTLLGSIPMVLALIGISQLYSEDLAWTVHMPSLAKQAAQLTDSPQSDQAQLWIFALLLFGLGIKTAILPLHTWLPSTYGQSHPTTSAFLAAVVLKMGIFGFIRLVLPFTPGPCLDIAPSLMGWLGAIAIVAGALMALAQKDLALLLAYSSLSHVGFITIGLFSLTNEGIGGAAIQMFNHGITTAALFLLLACLLVRRKNLRLDSHAGGLAAVYPRLAFFTVFFVVAAAGMPGLNNFVGELLGLSGMMVRNPAISAVGCLGILLGAWYSLRMLQRVFFGVPDGTKEKKVQLGSTADLEWTPKLTFAALATICLYIGIIPNSAIKLVRSDVDRLAAFYSVSTAAVSQVSDATTAGLVNLVSKQVSQQPTKLNLESAE